MVLAWPIGSSYRSARSLFQRLVAILAVLGHGRIRPSEEWTYAINLFRYNVDTERIIEKAVER